MDNNMRFVSANIGQPQHLNTVIDLFADLTMLECDRYGKPDGYPDQAVPRELEQKFRSLLKSSITNYDELAAGAADLVEVLRRIFEGSVLLRIKAVDWKSIDQWKRSNDELLRSL
jgi:hypothetical protein